MSDYNRQAASGNISWHKAAEADEALGDAYRKLVSMKQEMDAFEEIPSYLMPFYKTVMKAMGEVGDARKQTTQVRGMVRRLAR